MHSVLAPALTVEIGGKTEVGDEHSLKNQTFNTLPFGLLLEDVAQLTAYAVSQVQEVIITTADLLDTLIVTPATIISALSDLRRIGVLIPNVDNVRDYLLNNPELTGTVLFSATKAKENFSPNTQLSLEVYHDPEIDDQYLALYVRQEQYDDDIFDVIDEISEEYENDLPTEGGWFILTTDLHPPI